jgi:MFS family permease
MDGKGDGPAVVGPNARKLEVENRADDDVMIVHRNMFAAFLFWFQSWFIPGLGMFCESYFIFSIGNITPIFQQEYPDCFSTYKKCAHNLINDTTYVQVAFIIVGMLTLGYIADRIGRKWGSVTTASFMFIGGILLTASGGVGIRNWLICFTVAQAVFAYGVGGEYPIASSTASERAEASKNLRFRRGEMVVCTFAMQGWGNFINVVVLIVLLCIFGQNHGAPYNHSSLGAVWRLSFGLGLIPITAMLIYRIFVLPESKVWSKEQKKEESGAYNWLLVKHYWHRLAGTALSWFFWDVSFYGNKLFQSTFIKIISPKANLVDTLLWTLLNSGVALIGYYFAAFTIDKRWCGRLRMQLNGFIWVFVLFLICSVRYHSLISKNHIHAFQFLYFFSSFWGQFGPNCTTWLLAGEVFPTDVRATAHGIGAAVGKAGALLAAVLFNYINNQSKFYVCAFCNLAGFVVTFLWVPDIMRMDLREGDRRWAYLLSGRGHEYHGEAVNPVNLSVWEKYVLRLHKNYDPEADRASLKVGNDMMGPNKTGAPVV